MRKESFGKQKFNQAGAGNCAPVLLSQVEARLRAVPDQRRSAPMSSEHLLLVKVPERLLPVERGERYDEPLGEVLEEAAIGFVNGGGTKTTRDGDIEYCYLDVQVADLERGLALIYSFLRRV